MNFYHESNFIRNKYLLLTIFHKIAKLRIHNEKNSKKMYYRKYSQERIQ